MAGVLDIFDKVTVLEPLASLLEETEVLDFVVDLKEKKVKIDIISPDLIPSPELYDFCGRCEKTYGLDVVEIRVKYKPFEPDDAYFRNLLYTLFRKCSIC